ncbi:MAG: hypothetical protein KAX50_09455, partial [Saprospiraceae bacterium]|nr:hypothetical protein [Saprospiraceae bacterium]
MMRFFSKSVLFLFWATLSNLPLFAQSGGVTGMPCDVDDPLISIDPMAEWWAEQDPCCGQYIRHDVCYDLSRIFQPASFVPSSCEVRLLRFEMPSDTFTGSILAQNIQDLAQQMNTLLSNAGSSHLAGFTAIYPMICADSLTEGAFGELVLVCGNDTTRIQPTINTYDTCPLTIDQMRSAYEGMINGDPYEDLPLFHLPPDGNSPGSIVTTTQILTGAPDWDAGDAANFNPADLPSDLELGHALNMVFGSGLFGTGAACSGININCMLDSLRYGVRQDGQNWSLSTEMDASGLSVSDRQAILDGLDQWSNSVESQGGLAGFLNNALGLNFPNTPCPTEGGNLRGTDRDSDPEAIQRAKSLPTISSPTEADPDYFSQDIPGIGAGTMSPPTPSALAAIQAISGGVNLYNGSQSTSI